MRRRIMMGHAEYQGQELHVTFTARGELSDYGVPRSPTWTEWVDVDIAWVEILGVRIEQWRDLPPGVMEAIMKLADEVEFEPDEYDGPDSKEEE